MIVAFIEATMAHASYEQIKTGEYYGEIPVCPGVWATGMTLEQCRQELQEVLEDWLLLKLRDRDSLPIIAGIDLNLQQVAPHASKSLQTRADS